MFYKKKSKKEKQAFYEDYLRAKDFEENGQYEEIARELENEQEGVKHPAALLLDSSLIIQTKNKKHNCKVIQCGDTIQLYMFENVRLRRDKNLDPIKPYDINYLFKKENLERKNDLKVIEKKNIDRAKFEMQRLVKTNEKYFTTFITLTFADNITSIHEANKCFNSFRTYIKRLKSDFKYVCVPEFQKRGAVHYHLLTNIDYNDFSLLSQNEKKIWSKKSNHWEVFRTLKSWNKGFSEVKELTDINVVAYISKYMTKDIDNRLFACRRYFHSRNLDLPRETLIDLSDLREWFSYQYFMQNTKLVYSKNYVDYYGNNVSFYEYKKESF